MRRFHPLCVFFLIVFQGLELFGGEVRRAPVPDWVASVEPDFSAPTPEEEAQAGGTLSLLHDRQVRVSDATEYVHRANLLLNASGVDQSSRLLLEYEPSYQTLTLHRLWIHRDGTILDRTESQAIQVRERESGLESNLYYGLLTAEILLQDTRPGDVLEWAYSIRGDNPIFEGKFSESYGLASYTLIRRNRLRILLPAEHPERYILKLSENVPAETVRREGREILADLHSLPAWEGYPDAPAWFHPYPWISINAYRNWAEVAAWALPLYAEADNLPDELLPVREDLLKLPDDAERIAAALRYVQDTLRYISLSSGLHTHKPYPIADVLERRYGDCKDSALMLVALLRSMGYQAWPALVNSRLRHTLTDYHPSPHLFDHVVVRVDPPSGEPVWLDPTDRFQRGPLRKMFIQRYGKALLIRGGETGLVDMPGGGLEASRLQVRDVFTLPETPGSPSFLNVRSDYWGLEADFMRYLLAGKSLQSLQDEYADFYSRQYGEVSAVSPLQVEDDEGENRLTVREHWKLEDPWTVDRKGDLPYMAFQPVFVERLQDYPDSLRLERPYALAFPKQVTHDIRIRLPFPVPFEPDTFEKDTDYFFFKFTDGLIGNTIHITYSFKSKTDFVPAGDLAAHKRGLQQADEYSRYTIAHPWDFMNDSGSAGDVGAVDARWTPHAGLLLLGNLGIGLGILAGVMLGRRRGPPPMVDILSVAEQSRLKGVGGWMILPILGLLMTFFSTVINFTNDGAQIFDAYSWDQLTTPGTESYHALWAPSLVLAILANGLIVGFIPVHLINLFRRKAGVPRAFQTYYTALVLFLVTDMIFNLLMSEVLEEGFVAESVATTTRALIGAAIWTSYFRKSVRVKLTFTRP